MNTLINYFSGYTNYRYQNINNMYNLLINIFEGLEPEAIKRHHQFIKIHIGLSFYNEYCDYLKRKLDNDHKLLKLI